MIRDFGCNDPINSYFTAWSATHEGSSPLREVSYENLEKIMKQGLLGYEENTKLHMHSQNPY